MVSIIEEGRLTEVIRNIEPRRAVISDGVKIRLTSGKFGGIYEAALREEYELIEQRNYVAAWLMNRKDDGAIIIARK